MPDEVELEIEALGAQGDGIARWAGETVYVPLALPGERVRARLGRPRGEGRAAQLTALVRQSRERVNPPCPHFPSCSGCRLQHLRAQGYDSWKRDILETALRHQGVSPSVIAPMLTVPLRSRRRTRLAAERGTEGVAVGFRERASRRVADIAACLVLRPEITALIAPLRALLEALLGVREGVELPIALLDDGIDLVIAAKRAPTLSEREALSAFAQAHDLARLSWQQAPGRPEPIVQRRAGLIRFARVSVRLPPDAFLQATREAEAALRELVEAEVGGDTRSIVDLYCGAGAFSFALAERARVLAVDKDEAMIGSLDAASRAAGLAHRVLAQARDLERRPFIASELDSFDAVLLDPPRGGAARQVKEIVRARTPLVLMVSCNPASFARDARVLIEGGYAMGPLHPIDQFLFTPHLEIFAAFRRPGR